MKKKIQAIIYRLNKQQTIEVLALKRTHEKGGNWQPITGNVDEGESFNETLHREIKEEINVSNIIKYKDLECDFTYNNEKGEFFEKVFAVEIGIDEVIDFSQNPYKEHTDSIWVSYDGAFELFEHISQKDALNILFESKFKKKILVE